MSIGDLVVILYERKTYNLIVAKGQTSSSWVVFGPSGSIRTIPKLELKIVQDSELIKNEEI